MAKKRLQNETGSILHKIDLYLPEWVYKKVEDDAETQSKSRSRIMREIITKYYKV